MSEATSSSSPKCPSTPRSITATGWVKSRVAGRRRQQRVRVAEVGFDVVGRALGAARQQHPRVQQHQGVVVDVHDAALRGRPLGHLVGVVDRRQAAADVEELADPGLAGQVADGAVQELPVAAGQVGNRGIHLPQLLAELAVDREVVLAAQPVVPDPRRMRDHRVQARCCRPVLGRGLSGHGPMPTLPQRGYAAHRRFPQRSTYSKGGKSRSVGRTARCSARRPAKSRRADGTTYATVGTAGTPRYAWTGAHETDRNFTAGKGSGTTVVGDAKTQVGPYVNERDFSTDVRDRRLVAGPVRRLRLHRARRHPGAAGAGRR